MRLPRQKLGKIPNVKATKRSAKHKQYKHLTATSATKESTETMDADEKTEESTQDGEVSKACEPKTKEEKKAIRIARHKKNFASNHYKIRAGNISGKDGPRAINRGW